MRILIVGDNCQSQDRLAERLRKEYYSVEVTATKEEADELSLVDSYDVIIFNTTLPGGNTQTLCRELREMGSKASIMVLSSNYSVEEKIKLLDSGADEVMRKPFDFRELFARLRVMTRRRHNRTNPCLKVADLVMKPASRSVTRAGIPIKLSPREYCMLEYLMENEGIVLNRIQIEEYVWGMNYERNSNIVDVYVKFLRKKIDRGFEPKLIHTVRGAGYVIRIPR